MATIFLTFSERSNADFIMTLVAILKREKYDVITRLDHNDESGLIPHSQIRRSDIVIAWIDQHDLNVYLEVGYAIGAGKTVLIALAPEIELPSMLRAITAVRVNSHDTKTIVALIGYLRRLPALPRQKRRRFASALEELRTFQTEPAYFEKLSGAEFESLVFRWMRDQGWDPEWIDDFSRTVKRRKRGSRPAPPSHDFILRNHPEGGSTIVSIKKRDRNNVVPVGDVRELLERQRSVEASQSILLTTSTFSDSARGLAQVFTRRILLWTMEDILDKGKKTL
ncbi:MAG TPA: restriction endonuclease [Vicinamibacterales bacterium]|nr:restriction endonuclease [Vicinamibacterales bacterium]